MMWINPTTIKNFTLDLLFPKACLICRQEGEFLCVSCSNTLTVIAPSCLICKSRCPEGKICHSCRKKTPIRRIYTPFTYKNKHVRNLIHVYKYERAKELAEPLAKFVTGAMRKANFIAKKNMVIIPVPLHWRRERERGFNQSELIALKISESLGLPVLEKTMARRKNTLPQIDMKNDVIRRQNISGAFAISNPKSIVGKTIILVDDVITSGATINEAANTLREAGAKSVWAAAIARR